VKTYVSGTFGGVQQMIFDRGGSYDIPLGVHAHANWAFSAEGIYRITSTQTATLVGGHLTSDTRTLTIVVGDVDPASALGEGTTCGPVANTVLVGDDAEGVAAAAEQADVDAATAATESEPTARTVDGTPIDALAAPGRANLVPTLLLVLGGLLLMGSAGAGYLWWRAARRITPGLRP
jgi:surface-anchored protein